MSAKTKTTNVGVMSHGVVMECDRRHRMRYDFTNHDMRLAIHGHDVLYALDDESIAAVVRYAPHYGLQSDNNQCRGTWDALINLRGRVFMVRFRGDDRGESLTVYDMRNIVRDKTSPVYHDRRAAVQFAKQLADSGLVGMTAGSCAFFDARKTMGFAEYDLLYPQFDNDVKTQLLQAYRGGHMHCVAGEYSDVIDVDINSAYPNALANKPLPSGTPVRYEGRYEYDEEYPYRIETRIIYASVKPNGIAWLQTTPEWVGKGRRELETNGFIELTLCETDWKLLAEHYDIQTARIIGGWKFAVDETRPFSRWVRQWYAIKRTGCESERTLAKIVLNSMIGKIGQTNHSRGKWLIPSVDEEDKTTLIPRPSSQQSEPHDYIPVAIAVNAYVREKLLHDITLIESHGGHVVNCNTDGFAVVGMSEQQIANILNISGNMGDYKIADKFTRLCVRSVTDWCGERKPDDLRIVSCGRTLSIRTYEEYHTTML